MNSITSLVMEVIVNEGEDDNSDETGQNQQQHQKSMRLWCHVVCHNETRRFVPFPLRFACEFLLQVFTIHVNKEFELEKRIREKNILRTQIMLCDMMLRESFPLGIISQNPNFMDLEDHGLFKKLQSNVSDLHIWFEESKEQDVFIIGNGIGNDFVAGVEMLGLNYTEMVDPTKCSEAARSNVADDYGQLGVVILSPHGHFTQANVLGYPNTGGQVVYIMDQARVLENEMLLRIKQQGLDITPRILIMTRLLPDAVGTTCGQHLEKAIGPEHTDCCQILRVPLQIEIRIIRKWLLRFEVWPYLDTYANDVANELAREFQATLDLIIGNYSDGNLIASLLAHKLRVTQYIITHALKKNQVPKF